MPYCLNIGNTHTEMALVQPAGLSDYRRWDTAVFLRDELPSDFPLVQEEMLAACVVPAVREKLANRLDSRIHFLSVADYPEIDFSRYDCRTLGADRIANAAQAWHTCHEAVMVIDCGTAINSEIISSTGVFLGGAILPGRAMQFSCLQKFTAQLPLVNGKEELPAPVGENTVEAILGGVGLGVIGAVKELIERTKQLPGLENCRVLAVGGDSHYFLQAIPELESGGNDFTLRGIAICQPKVGNDKTPSK